MTRINAGIPPASLTREHLLAEHREIKRIPNAIKNGIAVIKNIPSTYRLGEGHVKFFYNKQKWLYERYCMLYDECVKRGYNVSSFHAAWDSFHGENLNPEFSSLWNDWNPSELDSQITQARINERLGLTN